MEAGGESTVRAQCREEGRTPGGKVTGKRLERRVQSCPWESGMLSYGFCSVLNAG